MVTPNQLLSSEYFDFADSAMFNRRFHKVRPAGVYDGGYITIESATSIRVKELICEITSIYTDTIHQIHALTTSDTLLTALNSTQIYVVLRWQYTPVAGSNDIEILVVALADIGDYDLILGILTWGGGGTVIAGVSYYDSTNSIRRSTPETPEQLLKVVTHPSGGRNVMVKYGRSMIGSVLYTVEEQAVVCGAGAGFIYVNSAGVPVYESGTSYTGKLLLATVNTDASIAESSITDKRPFTAIPSSSSNYGFATSVIDFSIAKDTGTGADGEGSFYDIPGMSVTVTTTGGPLLCMFNANLGFDDNSWIYVRILVDTTLIAKKIVKTGSDTVHADASLMGIAAVAAGAHTIKAQVWPHGGAVKNIGGSTYSYENRRNLAAIELG
jgi:hypothetical protein